MLNSMLRLCSCLLAAILPLAAAGVTVRWEPTNPDVGPFPSDALTVLDPDQKTGRRVNLPLPDCTKAAAVCLQTAALNQLDGFNVQARVRVRFSGPINPDTLRGAVWYVPLENLTDEEYGITRTAYPLWINQVIYDPETSSAYFKPDPFLDQHRRYALIVTDAVRDTAGDSVRPDPAWIACMSSTTAPCAEVHEIFNRAAIFSSKMVVGGTIFTTMSATAWIEKARDNLALMNVSYSRGPLLEFSNLRKIVWHEQTGSNPASYTDWELPFDLVLGINRIALGSFQSPRYLDQTLTIPQAPTNAAVPLPGANEEIFFNAYLPATPKPAAGYPVVIFGHGITSNRFESPTAAASVLGASGFATIGINAVGHGFGPLSTLIVTDKSGNTREIPVPGRGVATSDVGTISAGEGCIVMVPLPVGLRDCLRQTALDIAQLARMIRTGVDLDGDGTVDLDPNRIYYMGHSLGAMYGTLASAIEPSLQASVLNSGGGSVSDLLRWSPSFHSLAALYFAVAQPSLLNAGRDFNDNYVLRYQPAKVNNVAGAIPVQNFFEAFEWLGASGDPLSYGPHLSSSTLPGLPIKPVLWQYASGDQTVPNPTQTALVRAANMRENTSFFRNDRARAALPTLDKNPHITLLNILSPAALPFALAWQQQGAIFLASGGTVVRDANEFLPDALKAGRFFEAPAFLTESLNFLP